MDILVLLLPIIIGSIISMIGIILHRKFSLFNRLSSKYPTIVLLLVFFIILFLSTGLVGYFIGFVAGPFISSLIAVLLLNKFKFNLEEFWPGLFTILLFYVPGFSLGM